MKYSNFYKKVLNLLLIVLLLGAYQSTIMIWEKEADNASLQAQIASADQVLAEEQKSQEGGYLDGTYTGEAMGFGGSIEVSVTVTDGKMASIDVTSAKQEDGAYLSMAMDVVDAMLQEQSTHVDSVSGATYSSTGIKDAVAQALEQAVK